jgi:GAF domain-containing protein
MKRRPTASGRAGTPRSPKTAKAKRRIKLNEASGSGTSAARKESEVARLTRELDHALERQAATSEVLSMVSSSSGELDLIFRAILEKATRICEANFGLLFRLDNGVVQTVIMLGLEAKALAEVMKPGLKPGPNTATARAIRTGRPIHISDIRQEKGYLEGDPLLVAGADKAGIRTLLAVPMLHNRVSIGSIGIYRTEVRPFTDKQIALVTNFAAQAVIAIENARLLNELRQSLEQQTATSDVLKVISGSLGDLQPVFRAMLANAVKICDAKFGNLLLFEDSAFRTVAVHGAPQPYLDERTREPIIRVLPSSDLDRLVKTKQTVHVPDIRLGGMASGSAIIELANARTMLTVPMLKENHLVGAVGIYRQEVRPFTDKQIELVKNFASQAVIAIENARLLNELRQRTTDLTERTADLTEALEQQTATSEVLQVISSSPGDLKPVFATMLENSVRICDAKFGGVYRCDDDTLRLVATHNLPLAYAEIRRDEPFRPKSDGPLGLMVSAKSVVQYSDLASEPYYLQRAPATVAAVEVGGIRTVLSVPMLKEDELIGILFLCRQDVRPFTERQTALVQNFANQAVIAIENARLLNELRDTTHQVQAQSQQLAKLNQQLEQRVADQVGEIERMSRLRRFLPPQVADLIVASGTDKQLESHRREITALFCDLRGFTGFTESADAEDVMALLREYHAAIGEKIVRYSGTLERYAGDGVMVVFNDPVPVENPALQAVLMALELREAIGVLTATWSRLGRRV